MKYAFLFIVAELIFSCSGSEENTGQDNADSLKANSGLPLDSFKKDTLLRPVINTIEELAQSVFASVKSNSIDDYLTLLPTEAEINTLLSVAKIDQQTKELSIKEFPEKRKKEIEKSKERFAKTVQESIDSGIVWSEAQYYLTQSDAQMTPAGFEQAQEIAVIFTAGGKYFELRLVDCIKTLNGWRISSRLKFDGVPDNPVK